MALGRSNLSQELGLDECTEYTSTITIISSEDSVWWMNGLLQSYHDLDMVIEMW